MRKKTVFTFKACSSASPASFNCFNLISYDCPKYNYMHRKFILVLQRLNYKAVLNNNS